METDHDTDYNGVQVLASESCKFRLQLKETLQIQSYFFIYFTQCTCAARLLKR